MAIPAMVMTAALVLSLAANGGAAQTQNVDRRLSDTASINLVERTTTTINYEHRSGSTKIEFYGTILSPASRGEARFENRRTYTEVEVVFRTMQSAARFCPECLTYVMWAITPEGRATNLGEVVVNGTTSKLHVTTELQVFGLVVTAEPYFGVTQPSDVVVMENVSGKNAGGKDGEITAKYELLPRGQYIINALPAERIPLVLERSIPLGLYEARNAVRIARWAGADVYASDRFLRASDLLAQAENFKTFDYAALTVVASAREAVLTAEDARRIALKSQSEARLVKEREDSAARAVARNAAAAKALTDASAAFRVSAVARNAAAAKALTDASDAFHVNAIAMAQSERTRRDLEAAVRHSVPNNQTVSAGESEREKLELRRKLTIQLNEVLETEDGARGLIVNMAGDFFGTGQYSLNSAAKEKLSRISIIVLEYPALKLEVGGYTDGEGTEQSNMVLSENRANAVRDFLLNRGIDAFSISSTGFGEDGPVATNDTAIGRQQNRRVELVVSGEIIGSSSTIQAKVH